MASTDLVLNIEDNKIWNPGEKKLGKLAVLMPETAETIRRWFTKFVARVYVAKLIDAIDNQRYKDGWDPLTPQWAAFKEDMGWSENIWEATGKLKDAIEFWKTAKGWAIGINPHMYYPSKKNKSKRVMVRDVALWMEYGTGEQAEKGDGRPGWPGMPPRPLFRPLRARVSKDIPRIWDDFLDKHGDDVDDLIAENMAAAM